MSINSMPNDKFETSRLKDFADDDFQFGRKFFKQVENTVGKGEITVLVTSNFSFFPEYFQTTCTVDM